MKFNIEKRVLINFVNSNSKSKLLPKWWEKKSDKILFLLKKSKNEKEFINNILSNENSGFDHRVNISSKNDISSIIKFKFNKLANNASFYNCLNNVEESDLIKKNSIFKYKNYKLSNIFLTHVSHYLFFRGCKKIQNILEIGAGYGSLARIILNNEKNLTNYYIIDLPESLAASYIYLKHSFSSYNHILISNLSDFSKVKVKDKNIIYIPNTIINKTIIENINKVDILINTGSFQEMEKQASDSYFKIISNYIKPEYLYSNNYFLNHTEIGTNEEISQKEKPIIPNLNTNFSITKYKINNEVTEIDSSSRNYLEILLNLKIYNNKHKWIKNIISNSKINFFDHLYSTLKIYKFYFSDRNNLIGMNEFFPKRKKFSTKNYKFFAYKINELKRIKKNKSNSKLSEFSSIILFYCFLIIYEIRFFLKLNIRIIRKDLPCISYSKHKKFLQFLKKLD